MTALVLDDRFYTKQQKFIYIDWHGINKNASNLCQNREVGYLRVTWQKQLVIHYNTEKTEWYFQLKCNNSAALVSNVVC